MTPINRAPHTWPSMPNLSSTEAKNPLSHTPGLKKNSRTHSTFQLTSQSLTNTYKPEAIFINQKGAIFSKTLQSFMDKYLLTSFKGQRLAPGNIPREIHGVSHAIRTALWVPLLLSCHEEKLTERELEALIIAACLHDSGRNGDYADRPEWESISACNCERELQQLGYESTTIEQCKNAILHKDSPKSIFEKVLHDADCLEVIRVRETFDIKKLHIYQMALDEKIPTDRVVNIVTMIRDVIYGQADLQYNSHIEIPYKFNKNWYDNESCKRTPKNYDHSKKSKFEFAVNSLASQLLWLSQKQNSLYREIIDKCEFLSIDESFQLHSDHISWQRRGVKTISPLLRLHTDEPGTIKRTGLFTNNTKLNDLMSLSADFMLDRLSHISNNELPNFLFTLMKTSHLSCTLEIGHLIRFLPGQITASVKKLKALFESADSNIDTVLVFMDLAETYSEIDKFSWQQENNYYSSAYPIYSPILSPLRQFCEIATQAVDQRGKPYQDQWHNSYSSGKVMVKWSYVRQDSRTTSDNVQRVVNVDRLDQPPFTHNRNMESCYGFHQFGIHNARTKKTLKESVTVHPLAVLSSDQWDGKLYHGTQSTSFCNPSVKIFGTNPGWSNAFASGRPTGFYTDLDPLGTPFSLATKREYLPSFLIELEATTTKQWTQLREISPGWIVFPGGKPEGIRVNKVYQLSPRVRACINIFNEVNR